MKIWNSIKAKIDAWLHDEFEVTIYFAGEVIEKPDGSKVATGAPKTYVCSKLIKVTETHFKLMTTDKRLVEIKTVAPVGYDVVKIK